MKSMRKRITRTNFFNECGVGPGLDHMSAMKVIDEIKEKEEAN